MTVQERRGQGSNAGRDRRRFVKELLGAAAGILVLELLPPAAMARPPLLGVGPPLAASRACRWAMIVRPAACIGCGDCVTACRRANDLAPPASRIVVYRRQQSEGPEWLPVMCQQCDSAPCVAACPTRASYRDEVDGLVRVDRRLCVGCGACAMACPYNARQYLPEQGAMDGCDFCYAARLQKRQPPACVTACRHGALSFDEGAAVNRRLAALAEDGRVHVLRPERATRPAVFYVDTTGDDLVSPRVTE